MKKGVIIGSIVGIVSLFAVSQFLMSDRMNISSAQTSDLEYQKLLDRDKNVPEEKVERAFGEAKKIQDDILAIMAKELPEFKLQGTRVGHLMYDNPGRRGTTHNEITWQKGKTKLFLNFQLEFNHEDALTQSSKSTGAISMGEFFDVPTIGDDATLVKNVQSNTRVTSVSVHFVKARARAAIYLTNFERKTEKNEKELMEIVRLIEPLVNARPNFDDQ